MCLLKMVPFDIEFMIIQNWVTLAEIIKYKIVIKDVTEQIFSMDCFEIKEQVKLNSFNINWFFRNTIKLKNVYFTNYTNSIKDYLLKYGKFIEDVEFKSLNFNGLQLLQITYGIKSLRSIKLNRQKNLPSFFLVPILKKFKSLTKIDLGRSFEDNTVIETICNMAENLIELNPVWYHHILSPEVNKILSKAKILTSLRIRTFSVSKETIFHNY